jgi:hypothetical protein
MYRSAMRLIEAERLQRKGGSGKIFFGTGSVRLESILLAQNREQDGALTTNSTTPSPQCPPLLSLNPIPNSILPYLPQITRKLLKKRGRIPPLYSSSKNIAIFKVMLIHIEAIQMTTRSPSLGGTTAESW